jgi:hypothetical protein
MGGGPVNRCGRQNGIEIAATVVIWVLLAFARAKLLRYACKLMATSEHETSSMDSALDRIEAALDRIARATQRAKEARLEAANADGPAEVRHEILRERWATL